MSKFLRKKRIIRDTKASVKYNVTQSISEHVPEIKERLLTNFIILEDIATEGESSLDLIPFKEVFLDRLEEFEFIPENHQEFTLRVPSMLNFNFEGIELIEAVLEGIIGTYVEASHSEMLKLFGSSELPLPVNTGFPSDPVYILPITEWLVDKEKTLLGYNLTVFPFSNIEPLEPLIFGDVDDYVSENFDIWISQAISVGIGDAVSMHGGGKA